ncbi:MAG: decaprenyl-phosphate phosphoribosyltransferase [Anaerolineae bacterium]|nr:decaprenyl-phosphate phosphoribosyltransferase [Anaerolineae bacterium]
MSQLSGLIRTMRPKQWTKNGFIFIPLLFDRKLDDIPHLIATLAGFGLLCLISSTIYLINDLADIEADKAHPTKQNRPLPSGQLSKTIALGAAIVLPLIALPLAFRLNPNFCAVLAGYLVLQLAYSFYLKHIVVIDVMTVAAGFVLRVVGGVILVDVVRFSPWLYIATTMLALFLGFGKRRHELITLQENANSHRAILEQYNIALLDEIIMIVSGASILTYALYTFSAEGLPENHAMMLTIPFALYVIFRYLYLIHVRGEGGAPDEIILRDRPLQATVASWGIAVVIILYILK